MVHFNHDIAATEELALHIDLVRGRGGGGCRGRGRGGLVYLRYGRPPRVALDGLPQPPPIPRPLTRVYLRYGRPAGEALDVLAHLVRYREDIGEI